MKKKEVQISVVLSVILLAALFFFPLLSVVPFQRETPPAEKPSAPFESGDLDKKTQLRVLDGDTVKEMDLGTYLVGVVEAEMPASFEEEALKAQAVAARTYTMYKLLHGGAHGDTADICTDSTCCQAYISREQARKNWGRDADTYEAKIQKAIRDTDGQIAQYDGDPILAVFHASSAGRTRAAGQVWQNDVPYLVPVDSPEQGDQIPNYYSRNEFSTAEFREKVLAACPEADLSGPPSEWLKDPETDQAGSVEHLSVGGVSMRGGKLRSILNLRSACFTWEVQGDTLVFFVTGHGHGVGMSQYGANQMALDGADYREIVTHYYKGVEVGPYTPPAVAPADGS